MSAPLLPERVCGAAESPQASLPLAAEGVRRFVWRLAYGDILVEVRDDGTVHVNGERVEPIAPDAVHGAQDS